MSLQWGAEPGVGGGELTALSHKSKWAHKLKRVGIHDTLQAAPYKILNTLSKRGRKDNRNGTTVHGTWAAMRTPSLMLRYVCGGKEGGIAGPLPHR